MSKIIAKAFDATKRVVRAVFMGSPNLFTTSDLNRQIEAFKFQLDQLDNKVGLTSDIDLAVLLNTESNLLLVTPTFTTIVNRGMEFKGITGLVSGQQLQKSGLDEGEYYICVAANQELLTSQDDSSKEISGASFEDGSQANAASHYIVKQASFQILTPAELVTAKSTYDILFILMRVDVKEVEDEEEEGATTLAFTTTKYYTPGIEESAISIARDAENISKEAREIANNATDVCKDTAREVATEIMEAVVETVNEANQTSQEAKTLADRVFPLGGIAMWAGGITNNEGDSILPEGFHLCDGSHVNTTNEIYTKWAQMGYQVGANPAIILPDLRAKFVVGYDSRNAAQEAHDINEDYDQIGKDGGAQEVTLTASESGLPAHKHTATSTIKMNSQGKYGGDHRHNWFGDDQLANYEAGWGGSSHQRLGEYDAGSELEGNSQKYDTSLNGDHTHTIETTIADVEAAGATDAHENRPPYYVVAYIIRIS